MPDLINGLFELFGGCLLCLNIKRLCKDKTLKGVSWVPVAFFACWGFWNLIFYPSMGCWLSFFGGIFVVVANVVWLIMLGFYAARGARLANLQSVQDGTRPQ